MPEMVFAPDAIIRAQNGRLWVHVGRQQRSYSGDDPDLLRLLGSLATPRDEAELLSRESPETQVRFAAAIAELKSIGAVVQTDGATPPERDPVAVFLAPLADTLHRVAGDLAGLGSETLQRLRSRTGVAMEDRIIALLAGATALEGELRALREEHVQAQLAQLGIAEGARGLKLHLGAGERRLDDWINIDAHPAELALDLRWGLPFRDGSADYVFMSHALEHFYFPEETLVVLREVRRVLAPDGTFRVVVPDIEQCLRAYASSDTAFFEDRKKTWSWWQGMDTRLIGFLSYAGAGPRPSHFLESHKFGFDYETLAHVLGQAGFTRVSRSSYMASADPALRVDEASLVAGATHGDRHYSLFVDAQA